jgi:TetR/AcrR family transcriptional repressor of mexJK operon
MTTLKRGPGRPKSDSKRRQIFAAAIRLFVSQGYEGTRVEEIAERAKVSKQTVYSHFRDKDELYDAALTHVCEQLGMPDGLAEDTRDPVRVLTEIGTAFLTLLLTRESRNLYKLVVANADNHREVAKAFYETGPRTFMDRLSRYFAARTAEGVLAVEDPDIAAAQFFSLLRGELHMRAVLEVGRKPSRREIARYVTSSVRMFVGGYGGKRSARAKRV